MAIINESELVLLKKSIMTSRLVYSIIVTLLLLYFYVKTSNGKLILIPFLICSTSLLIKNVLLLLNKNKCVVILNKIFTIGFLLFWFGFLMFWCYASVNNKEYSLLLFSIPFWISGIYVIKKRFIKASNKIVSNKKLKISFRIIISCLLVILALLSGILMLFFGIKNTYKINKQTKNYLITNGYYTNYEIYKTDKEGTSYKLIYTYQVDNKEYTISTNYGTNYIPEENSIREVKYNPNNPKDAILVGTNNSNTLIYAGAFFILGSLTFVIFGLTILGVFDKFKIDIIGTYIGFVFLIIGLGVILIQNGTTMSLIETIKSFGLWIIIPIIFVIVGIYQIIKCLILKNKINKK